jgi:hypothetical protein
VCKRANPQDRLPAVGHPAQLGLFKAAKGRRRPTRAGCSQGGARTIPCERQAATITTIALLRCCIQQPHRRRNHRELVGHPRGCVCGRRASICEHLRARGRTTVGQREQHCRSLARGCGQHDERDRRHPERIWGARPHPSSCGWQPDALRAHVAVHRTSSCCEGSHTTSSMLHACSSPELAAANDDEPPAAPQRSAVLPALGRAASMRTEGDDDADTGEADGPSRPAAGAVVSPMERRFVRIPRGRRRNFRPRMRRATLQRAFSFHLKRAQRATSRSMPTSARNVTALCGTARTGRRASAGAATHPLARRRRRTQSAACARAPHRLRARPPVPADCDTVMGPRTEVSAPAATPSVACRATAGRSETASPCAHAALRARMQHQTSGPVSASCAPGIHSSVSPPRGRAPPSTCRGGAG